MLLCVSSGTDNLKKKKEEKRKKERKKESRPVLKSLPSCNNYLISPDQEGPARPPKCLWLKGQRAIGMQLSRKMNVVQLIC